MQAVTGPLRDLDVQLEEWDGMVSQLGAEHREEVGRVHALLLARRATALRRLRRDLRGRRFTEVWEQWTVFLSSDLGPEEPRPDGARDIADVAGERVRRVHRTMVKMGGAIGQDSPAEDLHELRKRGKELRYLLELFGAVFPTEVVKPMVGALKGLQDVLGRHEDRHVQIDSLRSLADDLIAGERGARAVLALGVLVERLEREQADARAEFAERFATFASPEQRKLVKRTFGARR